MFNIFVNFLPHKYSLYHNSMNEINNDFKDIYGNVKITNDGYSTYFSDLSASYPLKLITPALRAGPVGVGICYSLQYGGGLVVGALLMRKLFPQRISRRQAISVTSEFKSMTEAP